MAETYLLIGNVSIPFTWIAFLVASVITVITLTIVFGKGIANVFSDYLFTFILVWKFSVIITDLNVILQSPWTLLYFNGGHIGVICALVAVGLHIIYHLYRQNVQVQQLYALSIGAIQLQSLLQMMLVMMQEELMLTRIITSIGYGMILFLIIRFKNHIQSMVRETNIIYFMAFLFLSAWQKESIWQYSVLSTAMISSVLIVLFTYYEKKHMEVNE